MKTISTSLFHRAFLPEHPEGEKHPAVILLHGRGADEEDLLGVAPLLDPRLLVLSVRAPYPYAGSGGYTWYDVGTIGTPDPVMFRASCDSLSRFMQDAIAGYPVDPRNLFLFGFSMGTVMAFAMALSQPGICKGVSANSGYIPEGTHLSFAWDQLQPTEFFITHGTDDPIIPVSFARRAQKLIGSTPAGLVYREYRMGHAISDEEVGDIAAWLTGLIDR